MARLEKQARSRRKSILPELPQAFTRPTPSDENRTIELWRHHQNTCDAAALSELIELWTPLTLAAAFSFIRKRGRGIADDVTDLLSDGCLALVEAAASPRFDPTRGSFRGFALHAIFQKYWNEWKARSWGGHSSERRRKRDSARHSFRREFVRDHGRLPTRPESEAFMATVITNPNIQVGEQRTMIAITDIDDVLNVKRAMRETVDRPDSSHRRIMDREVIRLALKGLTGQDREMLKLAIEGEGPTAIGKRFGLTRKVAAKRINGLLWEARCRADLAEYLGVEPEPAVKRHPHGDAVSVGSLPAARRARIA